MTKLSGFGKTIELYPMLDAVKLKKGEYVALTPPLDKRIAFVAIIR